MNKKRPFIIDCDPGTDDVIALMAAFYSDEMDLKAITTVNGNTDLEYTSRNALDLVEYLGLDIPVARGADRPFRPEYYEKGSFHGPTGMGDLILPTATASRFDPRTAPQLICDLAEAEQGELELIVLGPMTNIGIALLLFPQLKKLIKHIWFMGGAITGGNVSTCAEFNIYADPDAAHVVAMSGIPMTMLGLDVTLKSDMTPAEEQELRAHGTKAAVLTADLLDYMFRRSSKGLGDPIMHDSVAVAAALHPECLKFRDYYVDIECDGTYTRGNTHVDRQGKLGKAPNMSVGVEIDAEDFRRWLVDSIKKSTDR